MSDPCQQAPTIDRMERKIDKLVSLLSKIDVQQSQIEHLTTSVNGLRDWMIKQDKRISDLEKAPGAAASRLWVVLYTSAIGAFFAIIVWLVTNGVSHG